MPMRYRVAGLLRRPLPLVLVNMPQDHGADSGGEPHAPHKHSVVLEVAIETECHLHSEIDPEHARVKTLCALRASDGAKLRDHGTDVHETHKPDDP